MTVRKHCKVYKLFPKTILKDPQPRNECLVHIVHDLDVVYYESSVPRPRILRLLALTPKYFKLDKKRLSLYSIPTGFHYFLKDSCRDVRSSTGAIHSRASRGR